MYDSQRPVYARFPLTIRKQKQILTSEERLYSLFAENLGKGAKSVRQTRNNPFSLFSRIKKKEHYIRLFEKCSDLHKTMVRIHKFTTDRPNHGKYLEEKLRVLKRSQSVFHEFYTQIN